MLVIFDIQHAGKPGKHDMGAAHDLDGDGVIEAFEHEAALTPIYVDAAAAYLRTRGAEVEILRSGSYASRHKKAAELAKGRRGPVAYVACHLNMGGGDYSLCVHDYRSGNGATLATALSRAMSKRLKPAGVTRHVIGRTGPSKRPAGASGQLWDTLPTYNGVQNWPRPWSTISGIYNGPANLSGVCLEPCFMDSHAALMAPDGDGLALIGRAVAGGLLAYFARVSR